MTDPLPDPRSAAVPLPLEDSSEDVPGTQALMRGIDVLMAISLAPHPPRFGEILATVNLPKGTLHRLLAALVRRKLIRYEDHTRRYFTGSRVLELARRTLDQSQLTRAVKPELTRIARELGRPTCLYVADGAEVFVIDFEDPDAAQARMIRVWPRARAEETAAGLTIAASLPAARREKAGLGGVELGLAQALGYVVHRDALDRPSVAAAVCDERGYPVAAISVVFDNARTEAETLHEAGRLLAVGARRAEGNVGLGQAAPACRARPQGKPAPELRDHATGRDFMGENPVWHPGEERLYWLDILAPALRRLHPGTGTLDRMQLSDITGGLVPDTRGRMMLLGQRGLSSYDLATGVQTLLIDPEQDRPDNRFNTASVAPDGAIWAGTMALRNQPGNGALYRIDAELGVTRMIDRIDLPKNCAWSPDGQHMYLSEGRKGALLAFDLEPASGRPVAERVVLQGTPEIGFPNGIACDAEGALWVAMIGGWSILRVWPDGRIDRRIDLPFPMPTSVCFGGADLSTLFITSTYLRLPPGFSTLAPLSGNLFSIPVGISGQPVRSFGG